MGIPELEKVDTQKGTPKMASVLQSQCRSLRTLSLTYPAGSAEPVASESKCANSHGEFAHIHVGKSARFWHMNTAKLAQPPTIAEKNLYTNKCLKIRGSKNKPLQANTPAYIYIYIQGHLRF